MGTLSNYNQKIKHILTIVLVSVFSLIFIFKGAEICKFESNYAAQEVYKANVLQTLNSEEVKDETGVARIKYIYFDMYVQSGYMKGEVIKGVQIIDYIYAVQPREIRAGDKILVTTDINEEGKIVWVFVEYNRFYVMAILIVIFLGIILFLGRAKGVGTILSLIYTTMALFMLFIPGITKGMNIYLLTSIISIFIILMSLLLINGFNKKTLCAILGNMGGVFLSAVITYVFERVLNITGLVEQDYVFLTYLETPIDLKALVWSGIVIGSLGAIMDVAMTIASSMNELSEKMRDKSYKNMFISGMNIGKDAIGTMTNTLVLAYVGGSLAMIILILANNRGNLLFLLNMEMIVVQVLQSVAGSMGILLCVPVTVLISAYLFNRPTATFFKIRKEKDNKIVAIQEEDK